MVALVNACHATQADLVVLFGLQLDLLLALEFLDLLVCVLLQLPHRLLVNFFGKPLLLHDALDNPLVLGLLRVELALHLGNGLGMLVHQLVVLRLPIPVDALPLGCELLVAAHLNHHLVLEGALQVLCLLGVQLHQALDVFFGLHLGIVLLLAQLLVLRALGVDLLGVLLLQVHHLLLVEGLPVPQLELDLIGKLFHLPLQFEQLRLLLVKERPGDKNLVCGREHILLVTLGHDLVLLAHVEDEQASVL
mmetsp:Transcript_89072/g.249274  ORF Transcript_89072/g.249274 Transcript_89072/m.249274 type:complete len:249 (-) Transcript_89072:352-1098(-)